MRRAAIAAALALATACTAGPPEPVEIDTRHDACDGCRMAISDLRFAAQVVAPGEEPKRFDDIGCLRDWLASGADPAKGAVAWVADHRTRAWVRAADAVYARPAGVATPMASGLLAWSDAASRATDPDAAGADPLDAADVFSTPPPGGAR